MHEKHKILYIDDDAINVKLFEINFANRFIVLSGLSGSEGLDILRKHPDVDVIISDMKMPEMNGLEFINKVKKTHKHTPCYMLTGYGITKEIQEAIDTGLLIHCFSKPFNKNEIEQAVLNL